MITLNVSGMSSRSLHTYLGIEYEVYTKRMQDRNITMHVGAQYNEKRLLLDAP